MLAHAERVRIARSTINSTLRTHVPHIRADERVVCAHCVAAWPCRHVAAALDVVAARQTVRAR